MSGYTVTAQFLKKFESSGEVKHFFEAFKHFTTKAIAHKLPVVKSLNKGKKDIDEVPFTAWRSAYATQVTPDAVNLWLMRKDVIKMCTEGATYSLIQRKWGLTSDQVDILVGI